MSQRPNAQTDVDPVTIEILNNRLHQIAREAGATLTRTAASPVTVEAKDLGFNITTPEGENVVFSVWMPRHGTTLSHMVRSTIDQFGFENIDEGDMFLTNDPYAGALHIMDLAVLAPVHYDGELIAWTGCATHHLDVGAMTAGWPSRSRDWYQEGVKYPPIKIMEEGEVRDDVFELFLRNVRMPEYQGLDLKAQIASNTVSRRRIRETADEYGSEVLRRTYEEMIEYGERTARERISALPDGEYRHVDYLDYDDVFRLECTLTVDGDELTFDFSGTDEQAPTFINCAFPCAEANLHNILQVTMFPDVTVNAGTFEPVRVDIPKGTIFNCTPPSPCAGASIFAGWRVMSLTNAVLSKAFAASDDPARASAEWGGGSPNLQLTGEDAYGDSYTLFVMDQCMLGGGARYDKDGEHVTNVLGSTNTSVPNVELHERRYPLLYLRRSLRQNSDGAGRRRGGLGAEFALTPYGVDSLTVNAFQHRRDSPPFGLFGGYPGEGGGIDVYESDGAEFGDISIDDRPPERTLARMNDEFQLATGEVVHARTAGGGGIGDPLTRAVDRVAEDLRQGVIDTDRAIDRYGIVMAQDGESTPDAGFVDAGSGPIDAEETERRREALRADRATAAENEGERVGTCDECGGEVYAREVTPAEAGLHIDDERFALEQRVCVECRALRETRVTVEGKPW